MFHQIYELLQGSEQGHPFFDLALYTGNATARSIPGSVDFSTHGGSVLFRARTGGNSGTINPLFSTDVGVGKRLQTDIQDAEVSNEQGLTSFDATGFSIGTSTSVNKASATYVAYSFAQTQGFYDVQTYTGDGAAGRTVAHALAVVPELVIIKARTFADSNPRNWSVRATGVSFEMALNTESGPGGSTKVTDVSASTITLDSSAAVNLSGSDYVALMFASAPGFSKVGTYAGNGSSQTVSCGFAPRFVLLHKTSGGGNWIVFDSLRGDNAVYLDTAGDEASASTEFALTADGFTVTEHNANHTNVVSFNYLFLAIA